MSEQISERTREHQPETEPTSDSQPMEAHQPDSAEDWHRLHPLSPLIRGWIVVLAVLGVLLSNVMDGFFRGDGPGLNDSAEGLPGWASMLEGTVLWLVLLLVGVGVLLHGSKRRGQRSVRLLLLLLLLLLTALRVVLVLLLCVL